MSPGEYARAQEWERIRLEEECSLPFRGKVIHIATVYFNQDGSIRVEPEPQPQEKEDGKMSTPELKPCPFCGSEVSCIEVSGEDASGERYGYWAIECRKCANQQYATVISGVHGDEKADAIRIWNTRHNPAESALSAAREALAFALTKEEGDMSDAEQCSGWDEVDWINAHARANRYRTALAQISPQQSKTT